MDPKIKDLVGRTNLGDLLQASSSEIDLNQPVETPAPPKSEPARSTVDPFQINFASTDIIGKLQDSPPSKGGRIFALVFLGIPMMIFGIGLVLKAWSGPNTSLLSSLISTVIGLAIAGSPYLVLSSRRKQSRRN